MDLVLLIRFSDLFGVTNAFHNSIRVIYTF